MRTLTIFAYTANSCLKKLMTIDIQFYTSIYSGLKSVLEEIQALLWTFSFGSINTALNCASLRMETLTT